MGDEAVGMPPAQESLGGRKLHGIIRTGGGSCSVLSRGTSAGPRNEFGNCRDGRLLGRSVGRSVGRYRCWHLYLRLAFLHLRGHGKSDGTWTISFSLDSRPFVQWTRSVD